LADGAAQEISPEPSSKQSTLQTNLIRCQSNRIETYTRHINAQMALLQQQQRLAGQANHGRRAVPFAPVGLRAMKPAAMGRTIRQERVFVVRATAEEQGALLMWVVVGSCVLCGACCFEGPPTPWAPPLTPPSLHRSTEVKEVVLGKAAPAQASEDTWIPICRPEDLPKGA
jgi:hypothetical protein